MGFFDLPPQTPFPGPERPLAETFVAECLEAGAAVAADRPCVRDIAYGAHFHQRLDIYPPSAGVADGLPVLLFLHGGGWTNGYKEWCAFMAPPITAVPAIFVSAGYRLDPQVKYPAPLDDCFAALAWLHANIADHGGDPARLFIGGHSAGGHLAALVTLRRDLAVVHGLPADVIKGCLPVSAIFQVRPDVPKFLRDPQDAAEASPLSHVAGNDTPFFITYGANDFPGILAMQEPMIAALHAESGAVRVNVLPGADHFDANRDQGRPGNALATTFADWARALAAR